MELSRSHSVTAPTAVVALKVEPIHVMTAAEQCAAVSDPIPNCEAVLSGKMAPAPFKESSNLDLGAPIAHKSVKQDEQEFNSLMNSIEQMGRTMR